MMRRRPSCRALIRGGAYGAPLNPCQPGGLGEGTLWSQRRLRRVGTLMRSVARAPDNQAIKTLTLYESKGYLEIAGHMLSEGDAAAGERVPAGNRQACLTGVQGPAENVSARVFPLPWGGTWFSTSKPRTKFWGHRVHVPRFTRTVACHDRCVRACAPQATEP